MTVALSRLLCKHYIHYGAIWGMFFLHSQSYMKVWLKKTFHFYSTHRDVFIYKRYTEILKHQCSYNKKSSFFIQLTMIFLFLKNIYKSSLKHQCSYNNLIIYFISKTQYMCWTMNLHFVLCVRNAYFVPLNCSIESSGILPCYQICCETWQNPWGLGDEFYPKPLQG